MREGTLKQFSLSFKENKEYYTVFYETIIRYNNESFVYIKTMQFIPLPLLRSCRI
jgi:hypothetical protein